MDMGVDVDVRLGRMADGFAILLELVYIVNIIHCIIAVGRLRTPNLGRYVNDKSMGINRNKSRHGIGIGMNISWRSTRRQAEKIKQTKTKAAMQSVMEGDWTVCWRKLRGRSLVAQHK